MRRGQTTSMGGQAKAALPIAKFTKSDAEVTPASRGFIDLEPTTVFGLTMIAAAALYFYHLGAASLGASEAYSAWAAALPSPMAILRIPVLLDPGKQMFYYILLHYFTTVFGLSETGLRIFSALSALVALAVVFILARSMFNDAVAASAGVLWACNPIIIILARRARMYPMFAAIALAHFMLLWSVRRKPAWLPTLVCGMLGALAIYTHLAALLLIGAEAAMLLRDFFHGRRDKPPWIALAIAMMLFIPYFPTFSTQSQALVYGHWLDWMGTSYHFSLPEKALAAIAAVAVTIAIILGPGKEPDPDEPLRWCVAWGLLPFVALIAGSVIVRPMFQIRYLIPCVAMVALIVARALDGLGRKRRNLAVAGITVALLILAPIKEFTSEPWRDIAAMIAAQSRPMQPIFFESGFLFFDQPRSMANGGFPAGYYRRPFDYYFRGANPRMAVPGWDPIATKRLIADNVSQAGGGWLVSWKDARDARAELPDNFHIEQIVKAHLVALYRIEPASSAH